MPKEIGTKIPPSTHELEEVLEKERNRKGLSPDQEWEKAKTTEEGFMGDEKKKGHRNGDN